MHFRLKWACWTWVQDGKKGYFIKLHEISRLVRQQARRSQIHVQPDPNLYDRLNSVMKDGLFWHFVQRCCCSSHLEHHQISSVESEKLCRLWSKKWAGQRMHLSFHAVWNVCVCVCVWEFVVTTTMAHVSPWAAFHRISRIQTSRFQHQLSPAPWTDACVVRAYVYR